MEQKLKKVTGKLVQEDLEKINELLFKLRRIDFKRRAPIPLLPVMVRPLNGFEKKEDAKKREEERERLQLMQNKATSSEKRFEATQQKEIVEGFIELIKYAFERELNVKEYFKNEFINKVIEKADIKINERIKESLNEYTLESIQVFVDSKIFDILKKEFPCDCEAGGILEAIVNLLGDILGIDVALNEIERTFGAFYGDEENDGEGIWTIINREKLNILLKKLGSRELNQEETNSYLLQLLLKIKSEDFKRAITIRGKIEEILKRLIYEKLEKNNKSWIEGIHEKEVKDYIKKNIPKIKDKDKVGTSLNESDYLDFGMCRRLIESEWRLFNDIFIGSREKEGFISKTDFFGSLDVIEQYGNPEIHPKPIKWKLGDRERMEIIIKKIEVCINNFNR